MSGIYALLTFIRNESRSPAASRNATATVAVAARTRSYPWLDLADGLADVLNGLMPAFLALVLLAAQPRRRRASASA